MSRSDRSALSGRAPPSDIEAEKAVLSAILIDNSSIYTVATELSREDFYHPAHQLMYGAMLSLDQENRPVDLITLSEYLTSNKLLDRVGGTVALAEIADFEATAANVVHYARIVREKAVKRGLIDVASQIVSLAHEESGSANELLDVAESKIFSLGQAQATATLRSLDQEVHSAVDHIERLMTGGEELTGLATGFSGFDELTGGLQSGDLIILASRPSMGKTALALNIACNVAVLEGKNVAIFSLEMMTRALVLRMLCSQARVDFAAFRRGLISMDAHQNLVKAASTLHEARIWIDDSSSSTVLGMRAKCRRLHSRHKLDLVIIDYLQLARGDTRTDSREQEISEISRGLKGLAKELDIPVLALSQLNRGPETRRAEDKRPMLADLRESGAIEQDADVIAFIYRDVVYNEDAEYPDLAELIIRKQRNGPTDTVRLKFEGRYAHFRDWSQDDYSGGGLGTGGRGNGPGSFNSGSHDSDPPF